MNFDKAPLELSRKTLSKIKRKKRRRKMYQKRKEVRRKVKNGFWDLHKISEDPRVIKEMLFDWDCSHATYKVDGRYFWKIDDEPVLKKNFSFIDGHESFLENQKQFLEEA